MATLFEGFLDGVNVPFITPKYSKTLEEQFSSTLYDLEEDIISSFLWVSEYFAGLFSAKCHSHWLRLSTPGSDRINMELSVLTIFLHKTQ